MRTIKLDYSIESPEERKQLVEQLLAETPNPNPKYLEIISDYLINCMEKQERKQKKILTDNRLCTVNKRETSYEGLAAQLENGEDGIYNLINENKHQIFQPKISITKKDLEEIPPLTQLREAIEFWERKLKTLSGRPAYIAKQTIIDLRKDQYLIKDSYRQPVLPHYSIKSVFDKTYSDETYLSPTGVPVPQGVSLLDPKICSVILCNYSKLKMDSEGRFRGDLYYLMFSFDELVKKALANYPLYDKIVLYKIDGMPLAEIAVRLQQEFGMTHTPEYISCLWRNKIPKLIASAAEDEWLNWYYLEKEKGQYKRCTRCGEIKLAHNKYFSKNTTSTDGFYSICKECRNRKAREKSQGKKEWSNYGI